MKRFALALLGFSVALGLLVGAARTSQAAPPKAAAKADQARVDAILAIEEKAQPSPDDVARLTEDLKSDSARVRAHAAHALGKCGEAAKPAVEALVALVGDRNPAVRREAVRAVLKIRPGPAVTLPLAKKLLADADPELRMSILHTLADVGKPAVPGLIAALKDEEAAKYACVVLAEIGPDAAEAGPALLERLKIEKRAEVRQQLILALGAVRSAAAVPALVEVLGDPASPARVPAAFALGRIGPPAKEAGAALTKGLDDNDPVLKAVSAWALVKIKPDDAETKDKAVNVLAESLVNKNRLARSAAFRALADIRPGPGRVLPAIKRSLEGADKETIREAAVALAEMGAPAVPALIQALKVPEHRLLVASVLGHIGAPAKEAVPALIEVLQTDKNANVRREVLLALGSIGPAADPAAPAIAEALGDPNEKVVLAACYALTKIGPGAKQAVPALKKLAADKDEAVRKTVAETLKAIEGP